MFVLFKHARTTISNINYLTDHFFENVDISKSKFERVMFELFNFVY